MARRIAAFVIVLVMVLMAFAGITPAAASEATDASTGAVEMQSVSSSQMSSEDVPGDPVLTRETYLFNFDTSAEGFSKETDYYYSEVKWDATAKRVSLLGDRADSGDEMLTRPIDVLDPRTDFTVKARWTATQQGNWQMAFPLFLANSSNTGVDSPNSIYIFYYSLDVNLQQDPLYFLRYRDAGGVIRMDVPFYGKANTEYHFFIDYIASVKLLKLELRDPMGVTLVSGDYMVGTNPNDGFTLGKVGVASHGTGHHTDSVSVGWVDDIWLSYVSTIAPRRDVVQDLGDQAYRLGWFADNFNDNVKDFAWLVDSGSWSLSGGAATLITGTRIRVASGLWDTKLQAKVTVTATGTGTQFARILFRWTDPYNYHSLEIWEKTDMVYLKRVASGVATTIWSGSKAIALNTPNVVKIDAKAGSLSIKWNGAVLWQGTDASSPAPGGPAGFGFETVGTKARIAVDDVRGWVTDMGSVVTTEYAYATQIRTVHTGSVFNGVDLLVQSSLDNITYGDWHYVKAGAESRTSDAEAYYVPDVDNTPYGRFRVDLRTTDDSSPALSEIAVKALTAYPIPAKTLGQESWQYYIGGMVNAYSGNLYLKRSDLSLPAKGWTLAFERFYNAQSSSSGPLGPNWTHAYNMFLTSGSGVMYFTDGDGTVHTFDDLGNGAFGSPRGLGGMKLVRNADSTYTLFRTDGSKFAFSSAGKLTQMTDRNANKLTMTYDANGRLVRVADDSGVSLVLAYDANGRISKVTDHNATQNLASPRFHSGMWMNGQNAFSSNNLYASTNLASATHRYWGYGFILPSYAWITKVEVCIEGRTAGDDDLGVRISTDGGSTWSAEQILNLPTADSNGLTCLDFSGKHVMWDPAFLTDAQLLVEVRYVMVGRKASADYLDWVPVRVGTAGRVYSYAYDASGRLARVTDPLQNSELYMYSGILEKYVDRANKVLRFVHDASSRITDIYAGQYNRFTGGIDWQYRLYNIYYYYGKARYARVLDAQNHYSWIYLDLLGGRPIQIEGPLAASGGCGGCGCGSCSSCGSGGNEMVFMDWDGENNCVVKMDGLFQATETSYDWRGNVIRVTDATGGYTENTWLNRDDGTVFDSLLVAERDKRGFVTARAYDAKGNLLKTSDPIGYFEQRTYDASGFLKTVTDKRGYTATFDYDSHGWRIKTTDPLGHAVQTQFDAVGRQIRTITPLTASSWASYNDDDWVVSETNDLGFVTTVEYNGRGDRIATVDANGNRTSYVVNVTCARAWKTIEADGSVTEETCDLLGRLIRVVDPNGKTWTYEYDVYSRRIREIDPFGQATQFGYDWAGNLVTRIDGNGKYTNSTYDLLNRLVRVEYQDGNVLTYTYDSTANKILETGYGMTRSSRYDALGRLMRMEFNFGTFSKIVQYTYDGNGNRKTMVYPDGFTVTYVWNEDGLLTSMQTDGQTWIFAYDSGHRRTSALHPNGLELSYSFDSADRLTSVRSMDKASGQLKEGHAYTLDKVANRKAESQESNNTVLSFDYTPDYNLNATTYENGEKSFYQYDPNDNRLYLNKTGGWYETYTYDEDSSLYQHSVYWGGSLKLQDTYYYDGNGNRVRDSVYMPRRGSSTYSFAYDLENRLVQKSSGSSELASYAYFVDGARIRRSDYGSPTFFLYDFKGFSGFEDIIEEYNATGAVVARYVQGPGVDEPLAKFYQGAWYYYHFDGSGSVTMLTRADKTVANRYVYDDFGLFREREEAIPNFYGFTGREYDAGADLYYYRARYYDPWTGGFLTRDPSGAEDGPNRYVYAGGNPVSKVDPTGRHCGSWWEWLISPALTCTHALFEIRKCNLEQFELSNEELSRFKNCLYTAGGMAIGSCVFSISITWATGGLSLLGCIGSAVFFLAGVCNCIKSTCKYGCSW